LEGDEEQKKQRPREPETLSQQDKGVIAEKSKKILVEILHLMEIEATVELKSGDTPEEIVLDIRSSKGGLLIGRRGQTLEALQYLVARIVGKEQRGTSARIVVDTENYHDRQRKKLEDTALRLGESAKRQRKTISLDNLSARERRIVHLALEDDPWLSTKSLGQGPFRRLLIIPQGDRKKKEQETDASNAPEPTKAEK
jgi:spoIIIJ-associated protein